MPRTVPEEKKSYAIYLMLNESMGQRQITKETGLSRPYLRKLAKEIGYKFPQNGVEILAGMCMCSNCGSFIRKSPSKIKRVTHNFCDNVCKEAWSVGPNHPNWKEGKTAKTFSSWVVNQKEYKEWKEKVLANCDYKCLVSGRDYDLECHHICLKSHDHSKAFMVSNGCVLNKDIHIEIHQLIRDGASYEGALDLLKEKYKDTRVLNEEIE